MTKNRKQKQATRAIMESQNVCYLEARKIADASKSEGLDNIVSFTASRGGSGKMTLPLRGNLIVVAGSHGGVGKTSVAALLATFLVSQGEHRPRVLLVDGDFRDGQIGFFYGLNLSKDRVLPTDVDSMRAAIVASGLAGLELLPAPSSTKSPDADSVEAYYRILGRLAQEYDYVVLDTAVVPSTNADLIYPMASRMVFVADSTTLSKNRARNWLEKEATAPVDQGGLGLNPSKIVQVENRRPSSRDPKNDGRTVGIFERDRIMAQLAANPAKIFENGRLSNSFRRLVESLDLWLKLRKPELTVWEVSEEGNLWFVEGTTDRSEALSALDSWLTETVDYSYDADALDFVVRENWLWQPIGPEETGGVAELRWLDKQSSNGNHDLMAGILIRDTSV